MRSDEFKKYVAGERPAFSQRVRMTETEFKQHIQSTLGIALGGSGDKTFAQKINQLRRFYFKIVTE